MASSDRVSGVEGDYRVEGMERRGWETGPITGAKGKQGTAGRPAVSKPSLQRLQQGHICTGFSCINDAQARREASHQRDGCFRLRLLVPAAQRLALFLCKLVAEAVVQEEMQPKADQ